MDNCVRRAAYPTVRRGAFTLVIVIDVVMGIVAAGQVRQGIDLRDHAVRVVATVEEVTTTPAVLGLRHVDYSVSFVDRHSGQIITADIGALRGVHATQIAMNDRIVIYYASDDPYHIVDADHGRPGSREFRTAAILAGVITLLPLAAWGFLHTLVLLTRRR